MAIAPIGGAAAASQIVRPLPSAPPSGFGEALGSSLQSVSQLEHQADATAASFAAGESVPVHDVMIATTESRLAVDALVAVRNRAVEAYQEIMRLQV